MFGRRRTETSESEESSEAWDDDADDLHERPIAYKALRTDYSIRLLKLYPSDDSPSNDILCTLQEVALRNQKYRNSRMSGYERPVHRNDSNEPENNPRKYALGYESQGERRDVRGKQLRRSHARSRAQKVRSYKSYEALSWCWGGSDWDTKIYLLDRGVRRYFLVPKALEHALRVLRLKERTRLLWIDAVCIDQSNAVERSHQVAMMADIYSLASSICIWLGDGTNESEQAVEFISSQLLTMRSSAAWYASHDSQSGNILSAVSNVMKRPWFTRRWILQEIGLAKKAMLYCGRQRLSWEDFADGVQLLLSSERQQLFIDAKPSLPQPEQVSMMGASKLVVAIDALNRHLDDGTQSPRHSLEYLVSSLSLWDSTEPRDTIYALLAISNDAVARFPKKPFGRSSQTYGRFKVDYTETYSLVCQRFIQFVVDRQSVRSRALDIICRPWAQESRALKARDILRGAANAADEIMPSWVLDKSSASFALSVQADGLTAVGRINADSLVGLPRSNQGVYNACGDIGLEAHRFRFAKTRAGRSMSVFGFILDTVDQVEEVSRSGNIPQSWFKVCINLQHTLSQRQVSLKHVPMNHAERQTQTAAARRGFHISSEPFPPQWFWRTLVADRTSDGEKAPNNYGRAAATCMGATAPLYMMNTAKIIDESRYHPLVKEYFRRVRDVIWNRSLVTTQNSRLGLARSSVQQGDLVCIIYGCSVPVILRPVQKDMKDNEFEHEQQESESLYAANRALLQKFALRWKRIYLAHRPLQRMVWYYSDKRKETRKPWKAWREDPPGDRPTKQNTPIPAEWCREHPSAVYYEFLGECYLHGVMEGEAVEDQWARGGISVKAGERGFGPEQKFEMV